MQKVWLVLVCLVGLGFSTSAGAAEDRFASADLNHDSLMNKEEFQKAFPEITAEAFQMIDTNKDQVIDRTEWQNFRGGHQGMMQENKRPLIEAPAK